MIGSASIKVERFPYDDFVVTGSPILILNIREAASLLRSSSFMDHWIEEKIAEHLENGGKFENAKIADDGSGEVIRLKSRYTLASDDDIAEYASVTSSVIGTDSSFSGKKKQRKRRDSGSAFLIDQSKSTDGLPRQAVVIIEELRTLKSSELSEAGIIATLQKPDVVQKLKTKQPPERIFKFYKKRFLEDGYMSEA